MQTIEDLKNDVGAIQTAIDVQLKGHDAFVAGTILKLVASVLLDIRRIADAAEEANRLSHEGDGL